MFAHTQHATHIYTATFKQIRSCDATEMKECRAAPPPFVIKQKLKLLPVQGILGPLSICTLNRKNWKSEVFSMLAVKTNRYTQVLCRMKAMCASCLIQPDHCVAISFRKFEWCPLTWHHPGDYATSLHTCLISRVCLMLSAKLPSSMHCMPYNTVPYEIRVVLQVLELCLLWYVPWAIC